MPTGILKVSFVQHFQIQNISRELLKEASTFSTSFGKSQVRDVVENYTFTLSTYYRVRQILYGYLEKYR